MVYSSSSPFLKSLAAKLQQEWPERTEPLLQSIGHSPLSQLRDALFNLSDVEENRFNSTFFAALLTLAQTRISSVPYSQVSLSTRSFYTEVTIVWTINDLLFPSEEKRDDGHWEAAVARLDMALIVAGAPNREETIQTLIDFIQQTYLPLPTWASTVLTEPPSKRKKHMHSSPRENHELLLARNPILSFDHAPSLSVYLNKYSQTPFIVRSHLVETGWPAICRRDLAWKEKGYLIRAVGRGRIVPVEIGGEYTSDGWGQGMIPFEQFLDRIGWDDGTDWPEEHRTGQEETTEPALYLAQHSLFNQFPALRKDILLPDYVFSEPEEGIPIGYKPPPNEEALVINVWIGGDGRSSPSHTDPFYNCYAQVVGQKRIFLTPPCHSAAMYPFSSSSTSPDLSSSEYASSTAHLLSNTSRVPIFTPNNQPPDREAYPKFYTEALADSLEGVLNEGDMLVMPPGWWHAMRQEGRGWGVSFWY